MNKIGAVKQDVDIKTLLGFSLFFCQDVIKFPVPPFHRELYADLESGVKRLVVEAPRSFAKSSVCSRNYPLFKICQSHTPGIMLISDTQALSEKWMAWLRGKLEDRWIQSAYGKGVIADKWTQSHFVWKRLDGSTCEVVAKGRGGQVRGYRFPIVVADDMENDELVRSDDQRQKLLEWFDGALLNTLDKDDQLIVVGTPLHPQCLLWDLRKRDGWTHRRYPAINLDGTALWPERWSLEALEQRKHDIEGSRAFEAEFMLNPLVNENPIFYKEWFREYDSKGFAFAEELTRGVYTVVAVDPAIGQRETSDYLGIVTVSATLGDNTKFYVRVGGTKRDRLPLRASVAELARVYDFVKANAMVIETVAYQEALAQEFRSHMEEHRKYPNIIEVKPDKDKIRRAWAIQPLLEQGRVYFDKSDAMTVRLMDEMLNFPTGVHDDMTDALCMALSQAQRFSGASGSKTQISSSLNKAAW